MIVIDVEKPKNCIECPMMRCGNCIPSDSRKVDIHNTTNRMDFCPIVVDFYEMIDTEIKSTEMMLNENNILDSTWDYTRTWKSIAKFHIDCLNDIKRAIANHKVKHVNVEEEDKCST